VEKRAASGDQRPRSAAPAISLFILKDDAELLIARSGARVWKR
jgi:hypothetical protein